MLQEYIITFCVELSPSERSRIEQECGIPACFEAESITARSASHAMRLFRKKHRMHRALVRTHNLCRIVYAVRPEDHSGLRTYRVPGLTWNDSFTCLLPRHRLSGRQN